MLHRFRIGDDLRQFLDGVLRKIRHSLQVLGGRRLEFEFRLPRLVELLFADLPDLAHRIEDLIAALGDAFDVLERIVTVRAADDPGDEGRFR